MTPDHKPWCPIARAWDVGETSGLTCVCDELEPEPEPEQQEAPPLVACSQSDLAGCLGLFVGFLVVAVVLAGLVFVRILARGVPQ